MNILIVDDVAANRRLLCAILEAEGHSILESGDGAEALTLLEHNKVDTIISDILMPRMDGYRFCYEVRASERFRHLPFIFYTASYTSPSDQMLGLKIGADKFLTKPAPASNIIQALSEASTIKRGPFTPIEPARELNLIKEYNQQLVTKLEQKITELTDGNEKLAKAKESAEVYNKSKSLFLANMSHELRTPLNAILGFSEMLQEEAVERQLVREFGVHLKYINDAGKHLLVLINDILDLSKIESGKMALFLESFDLAKMIDEVASTIRLMTNKNANTLHIQCASDSGEIHADQIKVRKVLFNLLSNAVKFTYKGNITLEAGRQNLEGSEWIVVRVTDTGIGLSPEQILKLFSNFTQIDASATRKFGGSGLGLVITRHFCQMMGGDVTVQSVLGEGSVFTIKLPAVVSEATA